MTKHIEIIDGKPSPWSKSRRGAGIVQIDRQTFFVLPLGNGLDTPHTYQVRRRYFEADNGVLYESDHRAASGDLIFRRKCREIC